VFVSKSFSSSAQQLHNLTFPRFDSGDENALSEESLLLSLSTAANAQAH
jgi:hypothetical protein